MNVYASYDDLEGRAPGVQQAVGLPALEAASREVDAYCGRAFYASTDTRYFGALRSGEILVDDLLNVSEIVSQDSDYAYTQAWAQIDYVLSPANGWPKLRMRLTPGSVLSVPHGDRAIRISGTFGYGDGLRASPWDAAGVTATVGATGTSMTLSASGGVKAGNTVLVDSEQMYVSAVNGLSATVVRGVNGTSAAAHAASSVSVAAYPALISQAVVWLAEMTVQSAGRNGLTGETIGNYSWRSEANAALKTRADLRDVMLAPFKRDFGI